MKLAGGIILLLLSFIFFIATLNVVFRWLSAMSETEEEASNILVSYMIPGIILSGISMLMIIYGIKLIRKKKSPNDNLPPNLIQPNKENRI